MVTTFNQHPYYDDFVEDKKFHQILFNPGFAVQGRELTQIQSILRDQIAKFGSHIFRHGSIVIPGNSFADLSVPFVKVLLDEGLGLDNLDSFNEEIIVGATSGVEGIVRYVGNKTSSDPYMLYFNYTRGNSSTGDVTFIAGEEIYLKSAPGIRVDAFSTDAFGVGSLAFIGRGVYFINGSFVLVEKQSTLISKYTNTPSCHVLLEINEEIIDSSEDSSLLDPAQGSYNFAAPGADRLKISLYLTSLPLGSEINDDYVEIMRYDSGNLLEHMKNPRYSELEKSLARRTFDESGHYVVEGLKPKVREHLQEYSNNGVYLDGDATKLVVEVEPGKAYIKGFEVDKLPSTRIDVDKARTADHIKTFDTILRPEYGQYILISDIEGTLAIRNHEVVEFYNDSNPANGAADKVGEADVIGIDFATGDTADGVYKLFIKNVTLEPGFTIESAGGVRWTGGKSAYVLAEYDAPISSGAFQNGELITHSSGRTATIKYWNSALSKIYAHKHDQNEALPRIGDNVIGSVSTTTSTLSNRRLITSIGETGLVFKLPKRVVNSLRDPDSNAFALSYTSQKELDITTDGAGDGSVTVSNAVINPIEIGTFVALGPAGVVDNSLFSLDVLGTTLTLTGGPASAGVKIYAAVTKTDVSPKSKTLTETTKTFTTPGTIELELNHGDVIEIISVIDDVGDITSRYDFFPNQTDYQYKLSFLRLKSGATGPSGDVVVTYKYYSHSIAGDFFCIDSYPEGILDEVTSFQSASTGDTYDLTASIDFRPTVGANNTLTGTGSRRNDLIIPETNFFTILQYFVPRIDTLHIDTIGNLVVKRGIPAEHPSIPSIASDKLALNNFLIPAYTKNASDVVSQRLNVDRFTMRDIQKIVDHVERVEDFAVLTASEISITNKKVIDDVTGLEKFKTGYIVESFKEPLTLARTTSPDFSSTFIEQSLSSRMEKLYCPLELNLGESDVFANKNYYFMLPYTEAEFAAQPLSSRVTNINPFLVVSWDGMLQVDPANDDWVEVRQAPTVFETQTRFVGQAIPASSPAVPASSPPVLTPLVEPIGNEHPYQPSLEVTLPDTEPASITPTDDNNISLGDGESNVDSSVINYWGQQTTSQLIEIPEIKISSFNYVNAQELFEYNTLGFTDSESPESNTGKSRNTGISLDGVSYTHDSLRK